MCHPRRWFVVLLLAVLFVAFSFLRTPALGQDKEKDKDKPARPAAKWEYKVIYAAIDPLKLEQELNKYGEEGWECVGAVAHPSYPKTSYPTSLVLKRPKP